jgi:hypothetical protein
MKRGVAVVQPAVVRVYKQPVLNTRKRTNLNLTGQSVAGSEIGFCEDSIAAQYSEAIIAAEHDVAPDDAKQ